MLKLKIGKVGNSAGLVLPKEVLSRLDVENGNEVFLTETEGCPASAIATFSNPRWPGQGHFMHTTLTPTCGSWVLPILLVSAATNHLLIATSARLLWLRTFFCSTMVGS
jgi:hypothetical protein